MDDIFKLRAVPSSVEPAGMPDHLRPDRDEFRRLDATLRQANLAAHPAKRKRDEVVETYVGAEVLGDVGWVAAPAERRAWAAAVTLRTCRLPAVSPKLT
jgi:hypothetical protein